MILNHRLLIILGVCLILSFSKWGKRFIYPLQLFTTWVHECGHAFSATLMGASSVKITLSADTSGLTTFKIAPNRVKQAIIASSGYLGASIFGCLLFIATKASLSNHWFSTSELSATLAILIAVSTIFWIRNAFGWLCMTILGLAFVSLQYAPLRHYAEEVLFFLAIQTSLNALFDIRALLSFNKKDKGVVSDALVLQKLFFLPSWFWALIWLAASIGLIYWAALPERHFGFGFLAAFEKSLPFKEFTIAGPSLAT